MSVPAYTNIIERFFNEALDPVLNTFVYNGYTALAGYLKYPLGLAVVLFIALMGIFISQGWIRLSFSNFIQAAIKIGLIYTFAMNWDMFSQWVVNGIQQSAEQISNWLLNATPISIPQSGGSGINGALQSVLIEVTQIGNWIWDMGSWRQWGPYFTSVLIFGFGYALVLIGLFEIVLAKIMLAILFATAPLFISFTLFKQTYSFFDRWLGMVVGFAFLMIFLMAVLALALSFMQWAIGDTYSSHAAGIRLVGFIPAMMVGFVGIGILFRVTHMAQSIGGAVTTASGSELLAGTVGGFIGSGLSSWGLTARGMRAGRQVLSGMGKSGKKTAKAGSSAMKHIRNKLRGGE